MIPNQPMLITPIRSRCSQNLKTQLSCKQPVEPETRPPSRLHPGQPSPAPRARMAAPLPHPLPQGPEWLPHCPIAA